MEQNQAAANLNNKFRKLVRVMYFVFKNEISKGKLLLHLNITMKRAKIAGMFTATERHLFSYNSSSLFDKRKEYGSPPTHQDDLLMVAAAFEMVNSAGASPILPGFGPSPIVRVTDSPFPLKDINSHDQEMDNNNNYNNNNHVDEAAEEFIIKFYRDLKRQTLD